MIAGPVDELLKAMEVKEVKNKNNNEIDKNIKHNVSIDHYWHDANYTFSKIIPFVE